MTRKTTTPKRTLITNFPSVSWKGRLAIFLAVFGFFWLFLEPMSSFQVGTSLMSTLGIWGYLSLFLVSGLCTVGYEILQRKKLIEEMNLIPLNVTLEETGTRYYLKTPRDMKIGIFIQKFIETIPHVPEDSLFSHKGMYNLSLIIIRDQHRVELNPQLSFTESGINGDTETECEILGRIKHEYAIVIGTQASGGLSIGVSKRKSEE